MSDDYMTQARRLMNMIETHYGSVAIVIAFALPDGVTTRTIFHGKSQSATDRIRVVLGQMLPTMAPCPYCARGISH